MNTNTHNAFPNGRWSSGAFASAAAAVAEPSQIEAAVRKHLPRWFALLRSTSAFFPIFQNGLAPLKAPPLPLAGLMEGAGESLFYWLDVARCSDEQIRAVAVIVGGQCQGMPAAVEDYMRSREKMPLRAVHVLAVRSES